MSVHMSVDIKTAPLKCSALKLHPRGGKYDLWLNAKLSCRFYFRLFALIIIFFFSVKYGENCKSPKYVPPPPPEVQKNSFIRQNDDDDDAQVTRVNEITFPK